MGKRQGRKLTREMKIAHPEIVAKKEILSGIEAGEPLKHIADRIRERYPVGRDRALRLVTAEFDAVSKDWMDLDKAIGSRSATLEERPFGP